jgi:hypothetical protein
MVAASVAGGTSEFPLRRCLKRSMVANAGTATLEHARVPVEQRNEPATFAIVVDVGPIIRLQGSV